MINKFCNKLILNENIQNFETALFFDRDGIIIKDKHYLKDPNKVVLNSGIKQILYESKKQNKLNIIITNQSGISRGILSWEDYEKVTNKMLSLIGDKNLISAIYSNSILPKSNFQYWRKPNPGMIIESKNDFNLNLSESFLFGDRASDIEAGLNAGIKKLFYIASNKHNEERKKLKDLEIKESIKIKKYDIKIVKLNSLTEFPLSILKI